MDEHRFCYPTVIQLEVGATAHGPRGASVGRGTAPVSAAEHLRPSTHAQLHPSIVRFPWSDPHLRAALGDHA
jgi:hypothetical protein